MKKVLALVLSMVMMLSFATQAFAQSEPDGWAVNEVDYEAARFLKAATGELDYKKAITREEFAIVTLHIYGNMVGMELPEMSVENPFTDCDNPLVVTAYGLGLVKGVSETEFNPTAPITREQMCVMLARIAQNIWKDMSMEVIEPHLPKLSTFADGDSVSGWAEASVRMMIMAGLIKGTDEGKINPLGNLTVQEALIVAKRAANINL